MAFDLHWDAWLVIFTAALAVFTALLAFYTYRAYRLQKVDAENRNRELATSVRTYSALFLNPAKFVGAYAVKTKRYLPISKDDEVCDALAANSDILILGRGGIGKSHAAVRHITRFARERWYQHWRVLIPDRLNLSRIRAVRIPKGNYILFFDDLHEFINSADDYTVFDVIDAVRDVAKRIRVIATLRSTSSALDKVAGDTKYFARFKTIFLDDWTDQQRDELAARTGISLSHWDGTPLSLKQPSDAQRQVYLHLPQNEKLILACAKTCDAYGLHYCDTNLLLRVAERIRSSFSKELFAEAITKINRAGFLKRADDAVQVYSPYLSFVEDRDNQRIYDALHNALLEPGFNKELFVVGRLNFQKRQYESATQLLAEYVDREPNMAGGNYRLGQSYERQNLFSDAIASFNRAIAIQPRFYYFYELAQAYEKAAEPEAAKAAILSARAIQSDDDAARLSALAEFARLSDEPETALDLITECLDEDPSIRHGWGIKGQILLRIGRTELAEIALKEALAREPGAFVYFGLGQVARSKKDWPAAYEYFNTAVGIEPKFLDAYPLLGQALINLHRYDEAIGAFEKAMDAKPANAHFGIGLAYRYKHDWKAALVHFELATRINPEFGEAFSWLGTAYERNDNLEKALDAHRKAVAINPRSKHFQFGYAQALAKSDKTSEAIAALNECLKIDPTFKVARDRLNVLLASQ